jgi:hypothetical protein
LEKNFILRKASIPLECNASAIRQRSNIFPSDKDCSQKKLIKLFTRVSPKKIFKIIDSHVSG